MKLLRGKPGVAATMQGKRLHLEAEFLSSPRFPSGPCQSIKGETNR